MRIGILTGGGDCPGLNAVIRAVAKAASKRGWETLGILGGYAGLLDLGYVAFFAVGAYLFALLGSYFR